jgi:hypothetical protein
MEALEDIDGDAADEDFDRASQSSEAFPPDEVLEEGGV